MTDDVKFGVYIANHGISDDPEDYVKLAITAEENDWDGFFIWDHVYLPWSKKEPVIDPWIMLAAIASHTKKIRIGTTVTALARRRPWKVARETVTLDHLSNGRFILGVGLGTEADFDEFGETSNPQVRSEKLDESLEIITGLWSGKPFSYTGNHFTLKKVQFKPKPVQERIPIWVGGEWPNKKPFRRAAKYDGVFPLKVGYDPLLPEDIKNIIDYIKKHRDRPEHFDVVRTIVTTGIKEQDEWIHNYFGIGITWMVESIWAERDSLENLEKIIEEGPRYK